MARPKTSNPAVPFPMRLPSDLLQKVEFIAKQQRRKPKDAVVIMIEDAVDAYEKANGVIVLPEPPAQD